MPASDREERYFDSHGTRCHAWLYRAATTAAPCIVMAHGFAAVKVMRLDAYAEAFCRAGYNVLVFDYRHFGDSEGEPRQILNIKKQLRDWHAALAYARSLDRVDTDQIVVWGTSLSGGHVTRIAAEDQNVAAVVSQIPHMSGFALSKTIGLRQSLRLTLPWLRDVLRGLMRRKPLYLPSLGEPGTVAAITGKGEFETSQKLYPAGREVNRFVAARILLALTVYSPGKYAARIKVPWLLQVASADVTTPVAPVQKAAARAPQAELVAYEAAHHDVYVDPLFSRVVAKQLEFLGRVLTVA